MPSETMMISRKRKQTLLCCKDRISALPDDLLVNILCLVPTKDAVTTMILSKRWRFVWTMLPRLEYTDSEQSNPEKNVWDFLDKSLQLHKAPSLESLRIKLGQQCPVHVDLGKWVLYAVERCVKELFIQTRFIQTNSNDNAIESIPGRSLVIDSPGLSHVVIVDPLGDYSIQNMPSLESAMVNVGAHPNDKFLRSFASVKCLQLWLNKATCCSAINFSRLVAFKLFLSSSEYWLEPLNGNDLPLSWSQPSSVPGCLLSQLEIFEWNNFGGRREEKQFVAYILSNSKRLKTAGISPRSSYSDEEKQKITEDLESMYRVSTSSQLLFSATEI